MLKVIEYAPEKVKEMLKSVYNYNCNFSFDKNMEKVLFSMIVVDRKFFVEKNYYDDTALPIGEGQTISQPSTVARMLLLSELQKGNDVLEIGAGSGWNACLAAFLVYPGNVWSIDRIENLVEKARENISELRNHLKQKKPQDVEKIGKISFLVENAFSKGKVWKRRYDKVIITAGLSSIEDEKKIKRMAKDLLKKNGILVCPYVSGPLVVYRKKGKLIKEQTREQYVFVPLLKGVE